MSVRKRLKGGGGGEREREKRGLAVLMSLFQQGALVLFFFHQINNQNKNGVFVNSSPVIDRWRCEWVAVRDGVHLMWPLSDDV